MNFAKFSQIPDFKSLCPQQNSIDEEENKKIKIKKLFFFFALHIFTNNTLVYFHSTGVIKDYGSLLKNVHFET